MIKDSTELRTLLRNEHIVIGTDVVIKLARAGKLKQVLTASNCTPETIQDLTTLQKAGTFSLEETMFTNEELGVACKKPFSISVIGIKA